MVTATDTDELISLKEIGELLARLRGRPYTLRQVQRLVAEGLPVTREPDKRRGYIRASAAAVTKWWYARTNIRH